MVALNASSAGTVGRSLILLVLVLLLPSGRSRTPTRTTVCFKPTDGYRGNILGGDGVRDSVLGKAVRDYVDGDQSVRDTYGQHINDWCVNRVRHMDYIFYALPTFNENI
jgi:hypothetical protein